MNLDKQPMIDWEIGMQTIGQKALAEEMIMMLMNVLPKDIANIKQFYNEQNQPELLRQVHRLHGAVCYCGLPRLKNILSQLETAVKNHVTDHLASLIAQLDTETKQLLEYYEESGRS